MGTCGSPGRERRAPSRAYRCRHFRRRSWSGSHFVPSEALHMYSARAARGTGPEPRRISAAGGGRPNYGARRSTIQLLLSKYLMRQQQLLLPRLSSLRRRADQPAAANTALRNVCVLLVCISRSGGDITALRTCGLLSLPSMHLWQEATFISRGLD